MSTANLSPIPLELTLPDADEHYLTITFVTAAGAAVDVSVGATWAAELQATRTFAAVALTVDATNAATGILTVDFPATVNTSTIIPPRSSRQWALYETIATRRRTVLAGPAKLSTIEGATGPISATTQEWFAA
jgi:hypothetical protein